MNPHPVSLRACLPDAVLTNDSGIIFSHVTCDSRQVRRGSVFVALSGSRCDGHQFAADAVRRGAAAVVVERPLESLPVPQAVVADSSRAWFRLCMACRGNPHHRLRLTGITGTNGKSTTAWLLRDILVTAGRRTGLLGTIEYHDGRRSCPASLTTPDAAEQARLMQQMVRNGVQDVVLEISSHALQQGRCGELRLAAAAVTNITHDHLDYHGTLHSYRNAKARLAGHLPESERILINGDDEGCRVLHESGMLARPAFVCGQCPNADFRFEVLRQTRRKQSLRLVLRGVVMEVSIRLIGIHNAFNALMAAALADRLNVDHGAIRDGLAQVKCVPGRLERIEAGQPFDVYVDYAHTPDALERCLETVRFLTSGRVICVFGAGGDRDADKRPQMGLAARAADHVILTSDNPRSESPEHIIRQIRSGMRSGNPVQECPDRRAAIDLACRTARPGDCVVIAGRGHETIQTVGDRLIAFDDRAVVRDILRDVSAAPAASAHRPDCSCPESVSICR